MDPTNPPADFKFTPAQLQVFNAAADRIVPPDQDSGASAAGAARFILGLLNGDLRGEQMSYCEGLDGIDREAMSRHGKPFAQLDHPQQDALLAAIEADCVTVAWTVPPREFFLRLVENVLEGFYADPANGGNQDAVSWKMIGYRAEGGTW